MEPDRAEAEDISQELGEPGPVQPPPFPLSQWFPHLNLPPGFLANNGYMGGLLLQRQALLDAHKQHLLNIGSQEVPQTGRGEESSSATPSEEGTSYRRASDASASASDENGQPRSGSATPPECEAGKEAEPFSESTSPESFFKQGGSQEKKSSSPESKSGRPRLPVAAVPPIPYPFRAPGLPNPPLLYRNLLQQNPAFPPYLPIRMPMMPAVAPEEHAEDVGDQDPQVPPVPLVPQVPLVPPVSLVPQVPLVPRIPQVPQVPRLLPPPTPKSVLTPQEVELLRTRSAINSEEQKKFIEFREKALLRMELNGRARGRRPTEASTELCPEACPEACPEDLAAGPSTDAGDGRNAAYIERRRRNNEAAKRSRDARREKEKECRIRCSYLEQERAIITQHRSRLIIALKTVTKGNFDGLDVDDIPGVKSPPQEGPSL